MRITHVRTVVGGNGWYRTERTPTAVAQAIDIAERPAEFVELGNVAAIAYWQPDPGSVQNYLPIFADGWERRRDAAKWEPAR